MNQLLEFDGEILFVEKPEDVSALAKHEAEIKNITIVLNANILSSHRAMTKETGVIHILMSQFQHRRTNIICVKSSSTKLDTYSAKFFQQQELVGVI